MIAKLQKFADSIFINIELVINIICGSGWEARVVGFEHFGLRYLAGIFSGRKGCLTYCRQEAKIAPRGCDWGNNDR